MLDDFENKGKIFTPVIMKEPIEVYIQTIQHKIKGQIYIRPSDRLIDELNKTEKFIAVTNAAILNDEENEVFQSEFLTVNSDQIIWILPLAEMNRTEETDE